MFRKILVANRGEIACRIFRTVKAMGIQSVAIYSDMDGPSHLNKYRPALHVMLADEAYRVGSEQVSDSYLRIDKILEIAVNNKVDAIHPGYGLLSENAKFAEACIDAGICFIGPPVEAIKTMGLKDEAKNLMQSAGIPVLPGYAGDQQQVDELLAHAKRVGYPLLIKARAGGGGKGMRLVHDENHFQQALSAAKREAMSSFADDSVILEKYLSTARHIEVQIFADSLGNTVHLFERDCSLQRRHQKVIEEAPAPGINDAVRESLGKVAVKVAQAVNYCGAGTVEFIVDCSSKIDEGSFYFMEMNTRLQVEHPVTEMITGLDLVEWQIRIADGEPLPKQQQQLAFNGHSIEARIYAEDPNNSFLPSTGKIEYLNFGCEGDDENVNVDIRVDSGIREADIVSPYYDPLLAKLIVHANSREAALVKIDKSLRQSLIVGCKTNIRFLHRLVNLESFSNASFDTGIIDRSITKLCYDNSMKDKVDNSVANTSIDTSMDTAIGTSTDNAADITMAVAALARCGYLDLAASKSAFSNWRLWGYVEQNIALICQHLGYQSKKYQVLVRAICNNHFEVSYQNDGETNIDLRILNVDGTRYKTLHVQYEGSINKVGCLKTDNEIHVDINSVHYIFHYEDEQKLLESPENTDSQIIAPMPGKITALNIKVGQEVKRAEALLTMEAMKMEITLEAPRDATISAIMVDEGEQVQEGDTLIEFAE